jgi:hypothetical protein
MLRINIDEEMGNEKFEYLMLLFIIRHWTYPKVLSPEPFRRSPGRFFPVEE